ncbi:MAG: hypothetical protein KKB31_03590 [Nanoarchaeota archaeon]|nr:hypothetical protein [Nanoarchaeota archaeon]
MTLKIKKWRQNLTKKEREDLDALPGKFLGLVKRQGEEVMYQYDIKR